MVTSKISVGISRAASTSVASPFATYCQELSKRKSISHCIGLFQVGFTCINPFHANGLFLHALKISENQGFSDVRRGYRKNLVA